VTYQLHDFQLDFLVLNEFKSQSIDQISAYISYVDTFLKNRTILIIFNAKSYHCSSSFDVTKFCPSVTYVSPIIHAKNQLFFLSLSLLL